VQVVYLPNGPTEGASASPPPMRKRKEYEDVLDARSNEKKEEIKKGDYQGAMNRPNPFQQRKKRTASSVARKRDRRRKDLEVLFFFGKGKKTGWLRRFKSEKRR